jgi:hypothetical protein
VTPSEDITKVELPRRTKLPVFLTCDNVGLNLVIEFNHLGDSFGVNGRELGGHDGVKVGRSESLDKNFREAVEERFRKTLAPSSLGKGILCRENCDERSDE